MAKTVLSYVLDQLSSLLREEGRLLGGLGQEVQLITNELGQMKAFLRVAETKEEDEPRLKEWIKQVQEAAYDTEDILDEFVSLFAPSQFCSKGFYGFIKRMFLSIKNLRARHRIALELQNIKVRIEHISVVHQRYQSEYGSFVGPAFGSSASMNKNAWRYSRDDALLVDEARLVGIEQPKQQLISHLLQDNSQLKVVSVVGMGGLGKTTLVKRVHEDISIRKNFPLRAWVTVSQTFDFQELLKSLIRQLHIEIQKSIPQSIEFMTDSQPKEFVKNFLQQARYVIVFDDVWDMEFWNIIKFVLPENNSYGGNRVMLTTRIMDVAFSASHSKDHVHKMEPLSYEESWTLFSNRTFEDGCCPEHLKNVVQAILGKCEGLPLAILAIGGILASKDVSRIDEWERVRLSLRGELEGSGQLDRVNKILSLSYNDLPPHLKTCLLYLSIYPEDQEIVCTTLVEYWIAERFIKGSEGMSVEDVGWEYLRQLVNRSLIQVTSVFYEGSPSTFRVHDLLREVILSKCRKQNMASIVTSSTTAHDEQIRWSEKVRRLVIHTNFLTNNIDYQWSSRRHYCFGHLRSLILFNYKVTVQESKTLLSQLLSSCRLLKVLDLDGIELEEIPNEIFNLFHLQFLNLGGTRVKMVPTSIGKLQNLEYLNLVDTEVRELPKEIIKLKKLRCFLAYQEVDSVERMVEYIGFKAPSQMLERFFALQKLDSIDATTTAEENGIIVKQIGKLTQLRSLGITNLRRQDGKELMSSLENLTNLKELVVSSTEKDEIIDLNHIFHSTPPPLQSLALTGRLEKLPQFITGLQDLGRIVLERSELSEDDFLGSFQQLPNLFNFSLTQAYKGEGLCFKAGGFLKVKELCLEGLEGLRWLILEEGAMPHLQLLYLSRLPLLESLPVGIQHLTKLQNLKLIDMSPQLIETLNSEQSEEYQKIACIPQVEIVIRTGNEWKMRHLGRKKT